MRVGSWVSQQLAKWGSVHCYAGAPHMSRGVAFEGHWLTPRLLLLLLLLLLWVMLLVVVAV